MGGRGGGNDLLLCKNPSVPHKKDPKAKCPHLHECIFMCHVVEEVSNVVMECRGNFACESSS